jgi:hypothetical protein
MRTTRWAFWLLALAAATMSPLAGRTQLPNQATDQGAQTERPASKQATDQGAQTERPASKARAVIFQRLTQGKDVWKRDEITNPRLLTMFDRFAAQLGVTDGQITLEQFVATAPVKATAGKASSDDADRARRTEVARTTTGPSPTPPAANPTVMPIIYRPGKLPDNLPPWFKELDTDRDGQVGLYEWKAAGRPVNEFVAMDQNGDGFLTVEEVLRHQRYSAGIANQASSAGRPPAVPTARVPAKALPTGRGGAGNWPPEPRR